MSGPLALLDAGDDDPPQALPPFDDVYTSHAANVYRFCLSQLGDAEAAEILRTRAARQIDVPAPVNVPCLRTRSNSTGL